MRNGLTFNGKHSGDFENVTVRTKDRPIFPSVKEMTYSAAERDGEYDFTEVNGHEYFNTRTFQIEFAVVADNLQALQKKMTALSRWFRGRGDLIFDDLPTVKWNARVIDSVPYMPERGGRNAVLSVTYKVMPFSELLWDLIDGPRLDDGLALDSDYPLETEQYFTFKTTGPMTTFENVPNVGDAYVKPIIYVTGAKGAFTITNNGKGIRVELPENETTDFLIDCDKELILKGNESLMRYVTGEFFELAPGIDNEVIILGSGTTQIYYIPRFLYDADFEDTLWGDEDD